MKSSIRISIVSALVVSLILGLVPTASTHAAIAMTFPVIGKASFTNDFDSARGSEKHNAIDIIAGKHQKVVAAVSGTITYVAYPQPSWGYMVRIVAPGGYEFDYIHLNNDTPGTDNGRGNGMTAYAPGVREGNTVVAGQLIGYVGDSGNAENTVSHLHFEMRKNGQKYNPYRSLQSAKRISSPLPGPVQANEIVPYGEQQYNLNVAVGDVDANGTIETVIGAGKSDGPKIKLYDANRQEMAAWRPFAQKYTDGVDVAVGNVTGDARNEIIVGGRESDGSHVAVFSYDAGVITKVSDFLVDSGAKTIVRVTAADTDGDGTAEIVTGTGAGQPARVKIYNVSGTKLGDFKAFGASFLGGIDVAAGDISGDNKAEIVLSRLASGSGLVRIFNSDGSLQREFWPYTGHQGGARVAVGNVVTSTPKSEIVATPTTASPRLRVFNGDAVRLSDGYVLESWWRGYYDPAAADGVIKTATGLNRRGSVQ